MKLTEKVLQLIKERPEIISSLVSASGRSYPTIMRWLENNDEMLTMAKCMTVICDGLGLKQEEILEPEVKA